MLDYSSFGAGVYAALGAVQMVAQLFESGGDDWGAIVLMGAKAAVPLIGLINPAVGMCVGLLLSLFTASSPDTSVADAMLALYQQIMEEVQTMITDALVQQNLATAYVTMTGVLSTWNQNPWYITETPNTTAEKESYYTWFIERTADFNNEVGSMFDANCLQGSQEPAFPPNSLCQGFCASGVLLQQIQFAQAHITTYQAAAQVATKKQRAEMQTQNSVDMTKKYARLLAASLTNWLDYAAGAGAPRCAYDHKDDWGEYDMVCTGHCIRRDACPGCTATLTPTAGAAYKYTGKTVVETYGCEGSCYGKKKNNQPKDICGSKAGTPGYCENACRNKQFSQLLKDWRASAEPQMLAMVRAFQLQFTSAEQANGKSCACPAPQYLMMESNASTCQFLCRAQVGCQAYQWTLEGEDGDGGLVLNYSSPVMGTCRLFACGYQLPWDGCETSDGCPSGTSCRVGDKRCLSNADCAWANEQDGASRDCTAIPRIRTTDAWEGCESSDQCNGLGDFCRVGDKRCLTDADCDWASKTDGASRDCTPIPKTVRWNFTSVGYQYCVNTTQEILFAGVTDLEVCKANCGNSCNACALGPDGCKIYENCAASVLWRADGYTTYMKDLSTSATAEDETSACTFVQYNK